MGQGMPPEEILSRCMQQKLILLTKIANITKQIEVRSRQKVIEIGSLPNQRQIYIDRLQKCENILQKACCSFPENQQEREKKILSGTFLPENCTTEEAKLLPYGVKCRKALQDILAMDAVCRDRLQRECNRLQTLMQAARKKKNKKANPV